MRDPPQATGEVDSAPAELAKSSSRARDVAAMLASAVALGAVIWWASRQEKPTFPTSAANLLTLLAAIGVHVVATLARGWRWHVVLRHSGLGHRAFDAYALTAVGYMGNTVLPARGGELLRTVLMSQRSEAGKREVLGSIVAERLLDVMALIVLLAIVTVSGVAGTPVGWAPAAISLGIVAAGAAGVAIYLRGRRSGRWVTFADRVRPFVGALRAMLSRTGAVLLIVSSAIWLSEGLIFYLVGRSLDLHLSVPESAFLVVIGSFFALIPAAPGYVGTYDAAVLFGLKALKISGGPSIAFVLLVRFVLFVPVTLVGLLFLLLRYGGLSRLRGRGSAP